MSLRETLRIATLTLPHTVYPAVYTFKWVTAIYQHHATNSHDGPIVQIKKPHTTARKDGPAYPGNFTLLLFFGGGGNPKLNKKIKQEVKNSDNIPPVIR